MNLKASFILMVSLSCPSRIIVPISEILKTSSQNVIAKKIIFTTMMISENSTLYIIYNHIYDFDPTS